MSKPYALIIDDKLSNINVLARLLEREGVDHIAFLSSDDLINALHELEHVEVIFLDLEMPGSDGFALLHDLKAHEAFKDIPIIAYTVHISEINQARQAGFDGFLAKPLRTRYFPQQLKSILNREPVWIY